MLLNLDEADVWVFWHGKVAVDEARQDHAGVEEECPVEPKPVYKLREEFGQRGHAQQWGEQDERGPGAAKLGRENLADDNLQEIKMNPQN